MRSLNKQLKGKQSDLFYTITQSFASSIILLICQQNVCLDPGKVLFRLAVKYYAADPVQLQEEQTR